MNEIKYFSEKIELHNKTIILRLDLNVPLKNNIIQDETKLQRTYHL